MTRRLSEMTWPEVERALAAGSKTVILPLGATEQHGPHLPLATDSFRADAFAERVASRLPRSLVAATLPFGCSDEHAGFPGLVGVDHETLAAVISDCAHRLAGWGVEALVILSAHGGNARAIALAAERIDRETPELRVWANESLEEIAESALSVARRDGVPPESIGLHAGEGETSEMLRLRPDLVRMERIEPGYTGDMGAVMEEFRADGLRPVAPSGVLGDPTSAEARRGERYLDAFAEAVAGEITAAFRRDG